MRDLPVEMGHVRPHPGIGSEWRYRQRPRKRHPRGKLGPGRRPRLSDAMISMWPIARYAGASSRRLRREPPELPSQRESIGLSGCQSRSPGVAGECSGDVRSLGPYLTPPVKMLRVALLWSTRSHPAHTAPAHAAPVDRQIVPSLCS
jgi:hypothetical protein